MNTGQRTVACLATAGSVLLTGCIIATFGTWQAYPGEKLPDEQTALIRSGHRVLFEFLDGSRAGTTVRGRYYTADTWWTPNSIRVLPGTHHVEVRKYSMPSREHVIFDAEAGETYTVHWDIVEEVDYIWVEDKSRSIVVGEKPPAE